MIERTRSGCATPTSYRPIGRSLQCQAGKSSSSKATRAAMEARGTTDVYIPFGSPTGEPALPSDRARNTQYAYRKKWMALADPDARDKRLLLHALHRIREHLRQSFGRHEDEPLFGSHAKADGDTTARTIVDFVNSSGHDVPILFKYDDEWVEGPRPVLLIHRLMPVIVRAHPTAQQTFACWPCAAARDSAASIASRGAVRDAARPAATIRVPRRPATAGIGVRRP